MRISSSLPDWAGEKKNALVEGMLLNRWLWLLPLFAWTALVAWSLWLTAASITEHSHRIGRESARNMFDMVVLTRSWNARHGGLYARISEKVQPNPYLQIPGRDIETGDGDRFTLINPAYMTRQLSELAEQKNGALFHITSLNPIRPANRADDWETAALRRFEQDEETQEVVERTTTERGDLFRYMAPLTTKKPCLSCHAEQGYEIGDIRGGISVSLPAQPIFGRDAERIAIWQLATEACRCLAEEFMDLAASGRIRDRVQPY